MKLMDPFTNPRDASVTKLADMTRTVLLDYEFGLGYRVRKVSGAEWQGRVVGFYSTELTPEGYAVESETHKGSVQIYPAKALERIFDEEPTP